MYNKVILVGNLTRDPELRYTLQGTPVANFRIAVTTKHKSGEGYKDETLFVDVVVFGKRAENCSQYRQRVGRLSWRADSKNVDGSPTAIRRARWRSSPTQ